MAQKNKSVGGHVVELLLTCGHVLIEPCEAAVFLPREGEDRTCTEKSCKNAVRKIQRVGSMYWLDASE